MNRIQIKFVVLVLISTLLVTGCTSSDEKIFDDKYDRDAAVEYALEYSMKRNPDYPNLDNNCTNFVSQCLVAGGLSMDGDSSPVDNSRISFDDDDAKWYITSEIFDKDRPPNYASSTSFVKSDTFFDYWSKTRKKKLEKITNDFEGRESFHKKVKLGDVVCMFNEDDFVTHIGLVTKIEGYEVYFCGNTNDVQNKNLLMLSDERYPVLGLLHMD